MMMRFWFLVFCGIVAASAGAAPLADRHAAAKMNCASCHGVAKPEPFAEVANDACLKCHGPLEKLQKKFDEKYGRRNPHRNHLGDVACSICHKGHAESSVYCENCHRDFRLPIR